MGTPRPIPVRTRVVVLAVVLSVTAACGSSGRHDVAGQPSADPTHTSTGGPMPTAIPAASGKVASRGLVTVLDDGSGAELCLGGVAESYPPQCGGPRLVDWSWADHSGQFQTRSGVRWGEFAVTGTFDGTSFSTTRVLPEAAYDGAGAPPDAGLFATPCPEPAGGWRVVDPERTTEESMQATFARAGRLPGYADSWLDQSRDPAAGQDGGEQANDPAYVTINVRVTEDVAGAEAELRKVWGGALCVTRALRTEKELQRIQQQLQALPGLLSSSAGRDVVEVDVVHDDGSLQAWADAVYGPGLVRISSALVPVRS